MAGVTPDLIMLYWKTPKTTDSVGKSWTGCDATIYEYKYVCIYNSLFNFWLIDY